MKFIEVVESSNGRPISIGLDMIEMFYPIVKFDKGEGVALVEVECGTEILVVGVRKVKTDMLYGEFKERLLDISKGG